MLKQTKIKPLNERIEELQSEMEAFVSDKVALLKAESPGVPEGVLRNILMARSNGCLCRGVLNISEQL